jgi:multidrug resistance efflux pump
MLKLDVKALQPRGRFRAGLFFSNDWTTVEVDEATAKVLHGDSMLSIRETGSKEPPTVTEQKLAASSTALEQARAELGAAHERIELLEAELSTAKTELEQAKAELESKKKQR